MQGGAEGTRQHYICMFVGKAWGEGGVFRMRGWRFRRTSKCMCKWAPVQVFGAGKWFYRAENWATPEKHSNNNRKFV